MLPMIHIQNFYGWQAEQYIEELARLRIEVFQDFPYLYDGDMAYETEYLKTLIDAPNNLIVMAFNGTEVVGAATGLPLNHQTENISAPVAESGYDIEKVYYLGESIIRKPYRNIGINTKFFEAAEQRAKSLGEFEFLSFCSVQRPADHPAFPEGFAEPREYWEQLGFQPTNIICNITWKDLQEPTASPKNLRFWMKSIDPR